jgi:hypothetical protein
VSGQPGQIAAVACCSPPVVGPVNFAAPLVIAAAGAVAAALGPGSAAVAAAPACGPALASPEQSVAGDDGRGRLLEPALSLMRQIGPQLARDAPGQSGHDDLVELMLGEHLAMASSGLSGSEVMRAR